MAAIKFTDRTKVEQLAEEVVSLAYSHLESLAKLELAPGGSPDYQRGVAECLAVVHRRALAALAELNSRIK